MKKNQGVTLIALVVTIIVLLILAVVSFRIITGDDGVMSKAETSASETERAKAQEQAELWIAHQVANYYEEGHSGTLVAYISSQLGTNGVTVGNYTITKATGESAKVESVVKVATLEGAYATEAPQTLEIEVHKGDKNGIPLAVGTVGATGKVVWTSSTSGSGSESGGTGSENEESGEEPGNESNENEEEEQTTEENGKVYGKPKPITQAIKTAENYGDYIDMGTNIIEDRTIGDSEEIKAEWRAFYKDETGVYAILSNYLTTYDKETQLKNTFDMKKNGRYAAYMNYSGNGSNVKEKAKDKADYMLANLKSDWSSFITNGSIIKTRNDITVTAAIDLETWIKSWNEKGYTHLVYSGSPNKGYIVGMGEEGTQLTEESNYEMSFPYNTDGLNDTLYFPYKKTTYGAYRILAWY